MDKKSVKTVKHSVRDRAFQSSFYPLDQPPLPEAGRLIEFYNLWNALRGDNKIPSRNQINFESLKGWHSHIRLVDLKTGSAEPKKIVILGEAHKQYWGTDTLFNQLTDMNKPNCDAMKKYEECLNCFLDYNYSFNVGVAPNENASYQNIMWIDLPLSTDGDKITHVIRALIPQ